MKIAIYGKGGIGKSTTVSNLSVCLAETGLKVMQIGCDPKADSTQALRHGRPIRTVLDLVRSGQPFGLEDMVTEGYAGVLCVEAGGPAPGLGCAGRGIIAALDKLKEKGAMEVYHPDVIFYDVLGDVVCGGFSMPMRGGYADQVCIITSGENMAIYAAANIAMAVHTFQDRGYAKLGGLILNRRDVRREDEKVQELAEEMHTCIIGDICRSQLVLDAEEAGMTLLEAFPDSDMAMSYRQLAAKLLTGSGENVC